jgi:hypothetical protein
VRIRVTATAIIPLRPHIDLEDKKIYRGLPASICAVSTIFYPTVIHHQSNLTNVLLLYVMHCNTCTCTARMTTSLAVSGYCVVEDKTSSYISSSIILPFLTSYQPTVVHGLLHQSVKNRLKSFFSVSSGDDRGSRMCLGVQAVRLLL